MMGKLVQDGGKEPLAVGAPAMRSPPHQDWQDDGREGRHRWIEPAVVCDSMRKSVTVSYDAALHDYAETSVNQPARTISTAECTDEVIDEAREGVLEVGGGGNERSVEAHMADEACGPLNGRPQSYRRYPDPANGDGLREMMIGWLSALPGEQRLG